MESPLRSSTTPATSMTSAEMPKMIADRAVLTPFFVAACSVVCWECPRGASWLSGASPDSCQGSDVPARLEQEQTDHPEDGYEDRCRRQPPNLQRARQLAAGDDDAEHGDDQHPFQHQHQRGRLVGEGTSAADPERVESHEHHRLD